MTDMNEVCTVCGLPKSICVCKELSKESQKVSIHLEKRSFGKFITLVKGLEAKQGKEIEKLLKRKLACGGTLKDGVIELQGSHKPEVREILLKEGFKKEMIVG